MNQYSNNFNVPATDTMFSWIEDMYALGPRRIGTEAGRRCEDFLARELKNIGFEDVIKDPIPVQVWEADDYGLKIIPGAGATAEAVPAYHIPYTAFTPPEGTEGKLLFVEPGITSARPSGSWKGNVVVADIGFPSLNTSFLDKFSFFKHDPGGTLDGKTHCAPWVRMHWTLYHESVKRGAAGFIGILVDHYPGGEKYYAPYGFKEENIHDKPIPGFWVDRVEGERIRRLAKKGKSSARLKLTGTLKDGVTHNVIATLPGKSDETFIIACHHDSPFSSAVEDASGCSAVLGAANHFFQTRELERTLVVMFTAGHFYGSIGTRTYIERNKGSTLDKTALEFHVEHIAKEAVEKPGGGLELKEEPEFTGAFVSLNRPVKRAVQQAIIEENLTRFFVFPAEGPFGDYPPTDGGDFHLDGVPIVNFISPPIYLLNEEDTLEKVARDRLEPIARAVVRVLRRLDDIPMKNLRRSDYPVRAALMKATSRIVHLGAKSKGIY